MDGLVRTKHFDQRLQQRGMDYAVVTALLRYGEVRSSRHGIESLIFTRMALAEIRSDHGNCTFKACERQRNAYIIVSSDGVLITVARSGGRTLQ